MDEIKEFLYRVPGHSGRLHRWTYPGVTTTEIKQALRVQAAFQRVLDDPDAAEALQHPALKPLLRGGGRLSPTRPPTGDERPAAGPATRPARKP